MKFEVFERLNSGAIALNAQEIRNSTHRGPFIDLVKSLVTNIEFRQAIGTKLPRRRMVDNELILRFFALSDGLASYRPPLDRFLNKFASAANSFSVSDMDRATHLFERAIGNVFGLWGANSFRLTDERGEPTERPINRALAETQLVVLGEFSEKKISENAVELRRALGELHRKEEFLDTIRRATGDRARTLSRIAQYRAVIRATV